jgi:hypothetical protein
VIHHPSDPEVSGCHVAGRCPACGHRLLFVAVGGYVTCSLAECPDPGAASDLLERAEQ